MRTRVGIGSVLASGKICTALMLAVASIAIVIPAGDVAFSQSGSGTAAEAPLFTAIDLLPRGDTDSYAFGTSGGEQVGYGIGPATGYQTHALLWRGSANSVVDLRPRGFLLSQAYGISSGQQVGYGVQTAAGGDHALLWRGSAASVVDLTPSLAMGTNGEEQVGTSGAHAVLWRGSAANVVDLHSFLPPGFAASHATSIDSNGDIVGFAQVANREALVNSHAFLWRRNGPKPSTSRGQNTTRC